MTHMTVSPTLTVKSGGAYCMLSIVTVWAAGSAQTVCAALTAKPRLNVISKAIDGYRMA